MAGGRQFLRLERDDSLDLNSGPQSVATFRVLASFPRFLESKKIDQQPALTTKSSIGSRLASKSIARTVLCSARFLITCAVGLTIHRLDTQLFLLVHLQLAKVSFYCATSRPVAGSRRASFASNSITKFTWLTSSSGAKEIKNIKSREFLDSMTFSATRSEEDSPPASPFLGQ